MKNAFALSSALLSVVLAMAMDFRAGAAEPAGVQPNIIVILADDLGYGDLGCYGHPNFKTPQLDRLAAEGARLTQFNCPMPFCAPTRASLLTGRYPFRCGMTSNPTPDGGPVADGIALPLTERTLAQMFQQAGYATAMLGKWHLGHQRPEFLPTRRGFDEYLGIPYSNDMRPVHLLDGEQVVEYPVVQTTLTRRYTERALRFLESHRSRPFFLYFAHAMPHKPLAPGEAFYRKSGAGLYGDVMAELDWSVGQVLAKLKELKLDANTLVIFTSDNGPWYGGSTGGLRGMKATSFEGGYRVPLLARWPGKIPAGHVNHAPAIMMDLFATALAAAKVPLPRDRVIDGKDIMPLLTSDAGSRHPAIFGQLGARLATVRDERWKLHVIAPTASKPVAPEEKWTDPRGPDGVTILGPFEQYHPSQFPGLKTGDAPRPMMLFDLEQDPGEQRDVAPQHPEVVARLKQLFDEVPMKAPTDPLQRTVDLNLGETQECELAGGSKARVKLVALEETRDPLRRAVREARVKIEVNGASLTLTSATYHLPVTTGGLQIDCPITRGHVENSRENVWALKKDARFRLWPAGSPWIAPGTFVYPLHQRWFASDTQMANEPSFVNGDEVPGTPSVYYHWGLDFGGAEGLVDVLAATDGLVVSAAGVTLPAHTNSPAKARYDVIYLLDGRDWYYRYSHLMTIEVKPGQRVKMGQRLGRLGKEGGSGGWSHLHFDITSRQPSGDWGIQDAYAYAWEAYQRQYAPKLIAVARPHRFVALKEKVRLDGSGSWSAAGAIARYDWSFTDGGKSTGPKAEQVYSRPGTYSEILKVTDTSGESAYDFAVVQVIDPTQTNRLPPTIHAAYFPTSNIRSGDALTFKVRTFRTTHGEEQWDFGDGSAAVKVKSDGNVNVHAKDGYAVAEHRYARPGRYLVRVERANERGEKAIAHLQVDVSGR